MSDNAAREGTDSTDKQAKWTVVRVLARPLRGPPGRDGPAPPRFEEIARYATEAEAIQHALELDDGARTAGTRHMVRAASEMDAGDVIR